MGLKLENVLTGFILFSVMVGLIVGASSEIFTEYSVTPDYVDSDGLSIMEKLNDINFISGFQDIKDTVELLFGDKGSTGSEFDILGSLKASAIGIIKVGTGIISAPVEIMGIITGFYTLPSIISMGFGLIIIIYFGYMLINELLGK